MEQQNTVSNKKLRRAGFYFAFSGLLLLFWVNGAVGIIGSEDNPANLLYLAVFFIFLVGLLISFDSVQCMSRTMFLVAVAQFFVPLFALFVWPAQATWGQAGVYGVLLINLFFVTLFITSGFFFRNASRISP